MKAVMCSLCRRLVGITVNQTGAEALSVAHRLDVHGHELAAEQRKTLKATRRLMRAVQPRLELSVCAANN